jgi:hypothetical protein
MTMRSEAQAPMNSSSRGLALGIAMFALGLALGYGLSTRSAESSLGSRERVLEIPADRNTLQRGNDLATFFAGASPEALAGIIEAYEASPLEIHDLELILLAEWWAAWDPQAARQWLAGQSGGKRYTATDTVFRVWARSVPPDALTAAEKIENASDRKSAVRAVLIGWDESLHGGFGEYVFELPQGTKRQDAMAVLAQRRVAMMGGKDALVWVDGLPAEKQFRMLIQARVSSVIAESEPELAASMFEDRVSETSRTGIPRRIGTRWGRRDPEAALIWLESLPPGVDRDDGVMETFRDWAMLHRAEAFPWIEGQLMVPIVTHPVWLEPAMFIYARFLIPTNPRRAVQIANMITDELDRNAVYTHIMRGWLVSDPAAAEAWIRSANLPQGVLKRGHMLRSGRRPQARAASADSTGSARDSVETKSAE